jgi:hypothetical protein
MALTADQIKQQYSGYAGWNDPNAILADFNATGGAGKGGSTGFSNTGSGGFNFGSFDAQNKDFLGQYKSAVDAIPTPASLQAEEEAKFNLPALRETNVALQQQAMDKEQSLVDKQRSMLDAQNQIKSQYAGADITQSQQDRLVSERIRPQQEEYNKEQAAYSDIVRLAQRAGIAVDNATAQVAANVTMKMQDYWQRTLGYLDKAQGLMAEQQARMFTDYQMDKEAQLNLLFAKEQAGFALTAAERQHQYNLALQEDQFQKNLKLKSLDGGGVNLFPTFNPNQSLAPTGTPTQTNTSVNPALSPLMDLQSGKTSTPTQSDTSTNWFQNILNFATGGNRAPVKA